MRVIDLLELIADTQKNVPIYFESPTELLLIGSFETTVVSEQLRLVFQLNPLSHQPLKRWELSLLLNQKKYFQHYLYVRYADDDYPIFGFRIDQDRLLLG